MNASTQSSTPVPVARANADCFAPQRNKSSASISIDAADAVVRRLFGPQPPASK